MKYSLLHRTDSLILGLFLFVAMIVVVLLGRWASRRWNREQVEPKGGVNSLFAALFALSGLILAFTFGMSQNRLEKVRDVIEQEANDIGTAVLRSDLYSDMVRDSFRLDFRKYVDAVILSYSNPTQPDLLSKSQQDAANAANKLWARATQQSKLPNMLIPSNQMIPALNSMFDIANSRVIILKQRVPDLVIYMLFVCVLATCFIGGFTSGHFQSKEWIIVVGFAVVTAMVVYTTLDLARPMRGTIKERAGKDAIFELRKMFDR